MGVGCRARFEDHSIVDRLPARRLFFFSLGFLWFSAVIISEMADSSDIVVGLTICGGYKIIFRPGRFFLIFSNFFSSL